MLFKPLQVMWEVEIRVKPCYDQKWPDTTENAPGDYWGEILNLKLKIYIINVSRNADYNFFRKLVCSAKIWPMKTLISCAVDDLNLKITLGFFSKYILDQLYQLM